MHMTRSLLFLVATFLGVMSVNQCLTAVFVYSAIAATDAILCFVDNDHHDMPGSVVMSRCQYDRRVDISVFSI